MKIYRVQTRGEDHESGGYYYFSRKKDAIKSLRDNNCEPQEWDFQEMDVQISKTGILKALNIYGGHPDNG